MPVINILKKKYQLSSTVIMNFLFTDILRARTFSVSKKFFTGSEAKLIMQF